MGFTPPAAAQTPPLSTELAFSIADELKKRTGLGMRPGLMVQMTIC
jgi:hypothetical protein